jgi:predicted secreted protein
MSLAIAGPGFLLQVDKTGTYTTIAEVKDINGPETSVDVVDVTNQDSPDNFEEILPTLKRGGTTSFDINFVPTETTHEDLLAFLNARSNEDWQIIIPGTGKSVQFAGYVVKWGPKFPVANAATASIDIRVSGPVTIDNAL